MESKKIVAFSQAYLSLIILPKKPFKTLTVFLSCIEKERKGKNLKKRKKGFDYRWLFFLSFWFARAFFFNPRKVSSKIPNGKTKVLQ